MSIKLTAEVNVMQMDGKDTEPEVSLYLENDGGDETLVTFWQGEDKKLVLSVDRDELLEAVARVSGGDIRLKEDH